MIGSLSGGERSRARLAGLLASAKNLLVLDEPTNHLDIVSSERLEEALGGVGEDGERDEDAYDGTLIVISHDRALIDATCDHLLVLDGKGGVEVFHGNYTEWHERQLARGSAGAAGASERSTPAAASTKDGAAGRPAPSRADRPRTSSTKGPSLSWMPLERLESELSGATDRIAEIDRLLGDEEVYRDAKRCRELLAERDVAKEKLDRLEEEWLNRAEG
jgi:energy-coupling factor transporter ATP-binding protein EcfA2